MSTSSVTRLEQLDLVADGQTTILQQIYRDKYKHFWCLLTRQSAILYYKSSRKVLLIFPEVLTQPDLFQGENESFWLHGIKGDKVLGYNISDQVKNARRNRKKKRHQASSGDVSVPSSKKSRTETDERQEPNNNNGILDGLLEAKTKVAEPEESGEIEELVGETIYLTESFVLYEGAQLIACLLLDEILIAVNVCPGGHMVSLHSLNLSANRPLPPKSSVLAATYAFSSYFISGSEAESFGRKPFTTEDWSACRNLVTDLQGVDTHHICGTMLATECERVPPTPATLDYFNLDNFRLMFGSDVANLNSKVAILGTRTGRVLWIPLKCTEESLMGAASKVTENPRILCDLHEPVVLVASLRLNSGHSVRNNWYDSLMFIGQRGKLVVMRFQQEGNETGSRMRIRFEEKLVNGPVSSPVMIDKNCLVYSTGKEMFRVRVGLVDREDKKSRQRDVRLNLTRYPVRDVVSLAKVPDGVAGAGTDHKLTICTSNGKVMSLIIGDSRQSDESVSMTTIQCGQRMKELMLSIQAVTAKTETLRLTLKEQNSNLSEVTKAGHLARLLLKTTSPVPSTNHVPPFIIQSQVCLIDDGPTKTRVLKCRVTNRTEWTFDDGWSICAHVCNLSQGVEDRSGHSLSSLSKPVISMVYQLKNWRPDVFTVFSFILDGQKVSTQSPILIKVYLHFLPSPSKKVQSELSTPSTESYRSQGDDIGIIFPISSIKRVDILTFLQPVGSTPESIFTLKGRTSSNHTADHIHSSVAMETQLTYHDDDWLTDTLRVMASQQCQQQKVIPGEKTNKRSQEVLKTSSLIVSKETLDRMQLKDHSLLQWIFQDNPEVSSFLRLDPSAESIRTLTADGVKVHFILGQMENTDVKLQVQTTSQRLFAEVWEALHLKLSNSSKLPDGSLPAINMSSADRERLLTSIKIIERKLGHLTEKQNSHVDPVELEEVYEDMRKLNLRV